jgi:hypothetical protein
MNNFPVTAAHFFFIRKTRSGLEEDAAAISRGTYESLSGE